MHHCHPCAAQPYGVAPAGYGPGYGGFGGFTLIVVLFILLVIVGWGGFLGTTA